MKSIILCIILISFLNSCSQLSSKTENDGNVQDELLSDEEKQYELLNLYTLKSDLKCTALINIKQISEQVDTSILLTEDGSIYEVSRNGDLYSNNENCIELNTGLNKPVEWIYNSNSFFSREQFYANNKFYEFSYASKNIEIRISESSNELIKEFQKYGEYMFLGRNYIKDNIVQLFDSESEKYSQVEIYGMEENESILRFLKHKDRTVIITDKAIYTFNGAINKEECEKYKDIECIIGYQRNEVLTELYANLPDIKLYFDGQVFIDKKGDYYRLKINYSKIRK